MAANLLLVACGGALGAAGRYLISLIGFHGSFPLPTLATNLLGAVAIGLAVGLLDDPRATLFFKTGVCGGFTTFSTFSNETFLLIQNGKILSATVYVLLSVLLGTGAVWAGRMLIR